MGIRGIIGDLINSYLSKRKQFVAIGKKNSKTSHISLGVPQGFNFGSSTFLMIH